MKIIFKNIFLPKKINNKMKAKLLIISLLAIFAMASCRKQQCPAYGKINTKSSVAKPC
jgi:hypothetical protein